MTPSSLIFDPAAGCSVLGDPTVKRNVGFLIAVKGP
jgi:hypothetical protein